MDTTIRNLDEHAYREIKARAALAGKTIGQVLSEAIRAYLAAPDPHSKRGSLRELEPIAHPDEDAELSLRVDEIVYGIEGGPGR
ncbi:hypothetical protein BH18GEM1_BH18GEM1_10650 [soil metagenome]